MPFCAPAGSGFLRRLPLPARSNPLCEPALACGMACPLACRRFGGPPCAVRLGWLRPFASGSPCLPSSCMVVTTPVQRTLHKRSPHHQCTSILPIIARLVCRALPPPLQAQTCNPACSTDPPCSPLSTCSSPLHCAPQQSRGCRGSAAFAARPRRCGSAYERC